MSTQCMHCTVRLPWARWAAKRDYMFCNTSILFHPRVDWRSGLNFKFASIFDRPATFYCRKWSTFGIPGSVASLSRIIKCVKDAFNGHQAPKHSYGPSLWLSSMRFAGLGSWNLVSTYIHPPCMEAAQHYIHKDFFSFELFNRGLRWTFKLRGSLGPTDRVHKKQQWTYPEKALYWQQIGAVDLGTWNNHAWDPSRCIWPWLCINWFSKPVLHKPIWIPNQTPNHAEAL